MNSGHPLDPRPTAQSRDEQIKNAVETMRRALDNVSAGLNILEGLGLTVILEARRHPEDDFEATFFREFQIVVTETRKF